MARSMSAWFRFLLPFLLIGRRMFLDVNCTILSKSEIQMCSRLAMEKMKCKQKILVQLAISSGKDAHEDEISTTIDTVANGSEVRVLQDPRVIKLSKSNVVYSYPLEYVQSFNRQPYEEVRSTDRCRSENCWDRNAPSEQKRWNWGICCLCGGKSRHRGHRIKCGFASIVNFSRVGTMHCLRWHPEWFPTFMIGWATMQFHIYIDISVGYFNRMARMELSPNNMIVVNDDHSVIAKLEGDLVSYKQPPTFGSMYLSHPPTKGLKDPYKWLIIDRNKYTESGALCDRIGTSYQAFVTAPSACSMYLGYCLAYQLEDYIREEYSRRDRGLKPLYSVARYGAVQHSTDARNLEVLSIPVTQTQNSIVILEINADNINFIVNRSPGKIIDVKSSNFEALSSDGYSQVTVVNIGELVAAFSLALQCPEGIQPSPGISLSLRPNEPKVEKFQLSVSSAASQKFKCTVSNLDFTKGLDSPQPCETRQRT